ncbi:MAG: peroxiredoxin-like family protein [Candidatus Zixiibacteriota bacterium]
MRNSAKSKNAGSVALTLAVAFAMTASALTLPACSQSSADRDAGAAKPPPSIALESLPGLETELAQMREASQKNAPPELLAIGERQRAALREAGIMDNALNVGDRAPEFELPNALGERVSSTQLLENGPIVVTFYRGGWCPYCNLQLANLQESLPHFKAAGIQLVAISPQAPDNSIETVEKHNLEFEVLSDLDNMLARDFGIAYEMTRELDSAARGFGLNVRELNKTEKAELPLAVTYGIDADGVIKYAFLDLDYSRRAEPADILAALRTSS